MHLFQPYYIVLRLDLFGALRVGQVLTIDPVTKKRIHIDTAGNSKSYMESFMGYTTQQSELIIKIFRHKMVHIAHPPPIFSHNRKTVTWRYVHENTPDHLILKENRGLLVYYRVRTQQEPDLIFRQIKLLHLWLII